MEKKILLLAFLKKEPGESEKDVLLMLVNAKVFSLKEGKNLLKELKKEELLGASGLTPKGFVLAQEIEKEFKL